jgi:endoglucanase
MRVLPFFIFAALCFLHSCTKIDQLNYVRDKKGPAIASTSRFLHVSGTSILDSNNNPILLRGVGFTNNVWTTENLQSVHHAEIDYQRVKTMGMNVIRFYMDYHSFEDDANPYNYKQSGWDWLAKNILWAKANKIYLILNMHIPQGGFQSPGEGDALWTNSENQNRLSALWKAIAARYVNEKQIAGFGLVNEPQPLNSVDDWRQLAQNITTNIRLVDNNHIIFLEKALSIRSNPPETADLDFPVLAGNNLAYEFHTYDPTSYAFQLLPNEGSIEGGKYPDENKIIFKNETFYSGIFNNTRSRTGTFSFKRYEGIKFKVQDPAMKIAIPVLVGAKVGGRVYFDSITVNEYNSAGAFTRTVLTSTLSALSGWDFWTSNGTGTFSQSTATGVGDKTSIYIDGNTEDCSLSNNGMAFIPKQGYFYQINGWVKGQNVAAAAECMLRIDFLTTNDPIYLRNKQYLESVINRYSIWSKAKNVPVYLGEYGLSQYCFDNNKGGTTYIKDMLDISKAYSIPCTYHNYHGDEFSLYYRVAYLPDPAYSNPALINIFTTVLNQ